MKILQIPTLIFTTNWQDDTLFPAHCLNAGWAGNKPVIVSFLFCAKKILVR